MPTTLSVWTWWWVFPLVLFVMIVLAAVLSNAARGILQERRAHGDMSAEEYARQRDATFANDS